MTLKSLNSKAFGTVETLLVILIVAILGGTGYYVYHANKNTNDTLNSAAKDASGNPKFSSNKKAATGTTDPTSDWTAYTSTTGKFSLKYPKTWATATHPELCAEGILLLGADTSSVGKCGSDDLGQITVTWQAQDKSCGLSAGYTEVSQETVVAGGVTGTQTSGKAGTQSEGIGSLPRGTLVVQECFKHNGTVYIASYTQASSYPDVLADFKTMVTKTLTFN